MRNRFLFGLFLSFSMQAYAATAIVQKNNFDIPTTQNTNLMVEKNSLKLNTEEIVQSLAPRSDLYFNLIGGITRPRFLTMTNDSTRVVDYEFSTYNALPLVTAQFTYYPWIMKWGK